MRIKAKFKEDGDLPVDDLCHHLLQPAGDDSEAHTRLETRLSREQGHQHWLNHSLATQHPVLNPKLLTRGKLDLHDPEIETSGIFIVDRHQLNLSTLWLSTVPQRRQPVEQEEKETEQFHARDAEDVYDLFNACNGVLYKGLLDIRKLEEFSPEESEALNVTRLREIWEHTARGCAECEAIIGILNLVRGTLGDEAEELFVEQTEMVDINVIDSIS